MRAEIIGASNRGGASRLLALCIVALTYLPAVALTSPIASAAARATDDTKHAVHLASPAVVRIIMQVKAQVTCTTCDGGGSVVEPSADQVYIDTFSGSGAFVSPDGYILTADHVVNADLSLVGQAADDYATANGIAQADAENTFYAAYDAGQVHIDYQSQTRRVFLSTGYTGTLTARSQLKGFDVQSVAASSPEERQDTAILKINVHDMPFLTLAPKSSISVQDTVTAVAYPGDADTADFPALLTPSATDANSLSSLLTPTVETGSIIKQDTLDDGSVAYETTDISFHGSSGGAVINASGQIVGFVDRFTSDPSSNRVTILYSSDTAAIYTKKAGIPASPSGAFMSKWTQAINEYDATTSCHFSRAATDLTALHTAYPQFGGVQPYLDDANAKATPATCATASSGGQSALIVVIGVASGMLVIALTVLLIVLLRRRRSGVAASALAGGYGMQPAPTLPGAYPPPGPTGGYPQLGYPPAQAPYPPGGSPAPQLQTPRTVQYPPAFGQPQVQPPPPAIRQAGPMQPPRPGDPDARTVLAPRPKPADAGLGGQPPSTASSGTPRRCPNGHDVANVGATYCPVCGAPL